MVDAAPARALAVLTRAPSARGKSRLFRDLGAAPDPTLLTALLLDTLEAASVPGVARYVAVTPASACDEVRALVGHDVRVVPQPEGDLGARMREAMTTMFAEGATMAALIGSDVPHLPPARVDAAFSRLARNPETVVLGPALDGGYYLVAATTVPPIFDGPHWGGAHVLDETRRLAETARLTIHLLDPLTDVDDIEGLRVALASEGASRTRAWWVAHVRPSPYS